jgi:hypothetical protein
LRRVSLMDRLRHGLKATDFRGLEKFG